MFRHILIPTDGSKLSAKAVKAGLALAKQTGAKVTGYQALEPVPTYVYGENYVGAAKIRSEFEARSREAGERNLAAMEKAAAKAGVPFEPLLGKAVAPERGIIDAAKKRHCDVIFMASHGYGGLAGLLLGSVTQKVLSHSKIPVLVYR